MATLFFPRGGSAQVARALALALAACDWDVTLVCSSLAASPIEPGPGDARQFYGELPARGIELHPVDCTAALCAPDPLRATPPLPPSYEDRAGAPERVFACLDEATYRHQCRAWEQVLRQVHAADADLLHLHHLTPQYAAAHAVAPHVPIVGHLHGTELLMLEAITAGPPPQWSFATEWAGCLREWAQSARLLLVPSPTVVARVQTQLRVDAAQVAHLPNGFDPAQFHPCRVLDPAERRARWQRVLVEKPRGWAPGEAPGSVRYTIEQVQSFAQGPVLIYVGRFLAFKRLDVLLRAYAQAQPRFSAPAPLVVVGGYPGEWEGDHPLRVIERLGVSNVFLAGWRTQSEVSALYAAADVVVMPSVGEQFGLALVEGMACGLPAVAVDAAHGPRELVADGQTGWLVPPDDEARLAQVLIQAVNDAPERERRGAAAAQSMRARYAWPSVGPQLASLYEAILDPSGGRRRAVRSTEPTRLAGGDHAGDT
jgi:glycosyltransferase involved in cell wall biosynthesis